MPFYAGDWLRCPELRVLPPDVRGLWMDMLCYMWESVERGVMVMPNGQPCTKEDVVRIIGTDSSGSTGWLDVLIDNKVCEVREDGAIYSRRMVKDNLMKNVGWLVRREEKLPKLKFLFLKRKYHLIHHNSQRQQIHHRFHLSNRRRWRKLRSINMLIT